VEDGGELKVHSYPLEQTHVVDTSVSIISMVKGLDESSSRPLVDFGALNDNLIK
jgi:hypothetical protein